MKISIFALHLGVGGVEKYVISLANVLANDLNHEVEIIATYRVEHSPAFPLNKNVKVTYLFDTYPHRNEMKESLKNFDLSLLFKSITSNVKIVMQKKYKNVSAVKNLDSHVVISTRTFHNKILGKYKTKDRILIATEHNYHCNNVKYVDEVVSSVANFDYLIPISKELTIFYKDKLENNSIKVLNIPFFVERNGKFSKQNFNNIISIGRFEEEKGYADLLRVYKKICDIGLKTKLYLVGDGSQKEELIMLSKKLNIYDHVSFTGFLDSNSIGTLLEKSSVYLFTSYHESFGISVLEAMASGVVPFGYDSATGVVEILSGLETHLVSNRNEEVLSKKVISFLTLSQSERLMFSKKCVEVSQEYSYEQFKRNWSEFMGEL